MKRREGFTTGSCAAAAALASCLWRLGGECPQRVEIALPDGRAFAPAVLARGDYTCGVIKDAGDDPDVTDGCEVRARVVLFDGEGPLIFRAGPGVGTITRPGLKLPPGEAAVNPGPRSQIERALRSQIGPRLAAVEISIPGGEALAALTFNPRLGIVGGLSVLGTTGVVRPMSEEALIETVELEIGMARAQGARTLLMTFGSQGEAALRALYPDRPIVQASNFVGAALDAAVRAGFSAALLGGHAGKLCKVAAGAMRTHNRDVDARREAILAQLALMGAPVDLCRAVYACQTTDAAAEIIARAGFLAVWDRVAARAAEYCRLRARGALEVGCLVFDAGGNALGRGGDVF